MARQPFTGTNDPLFSRTVFVARGLAILLVVLGHSLVVAQMRFPDSLSLGLMVEVNSWIYSFHMHFFFFLAGLALMTFSRNAKGLPALTRRLRRLLVPYLVFSAVVSGVKVFVPHLATMQVEEGFGVLVQVLLYPRKNPMSVLWFLHSMFLMSLIAVVAGKWLIRVPAWILFPALLILQAVPKTDNILGYKDLVTFSIPFFLGYALPGIWTRFALRPPRWAFLFWLASPLVHFALKDVVPRYHLMAITGTLGIPMLLVLSRWLVDHSRGRVVGVLIRFGRLSLQVYLLSYFVEHTLRILVLNGLDLSLPSIAWVGLDMLVNPAVSLGIAMVIGSIPLLPQVLFGESRRNGGRAK